MQISFATRILGEGTRIPRQYIELVHEAAWPRPACLFRVHLRHEYSCLLTRSLKRPPNVERPWRVAPPMQEVGTLFSQYPPSLPVQDSSTNYCRAWRGGGGREGGVSPVFRDLGRSLILLAGVDHNAPACTMNGICAPVESTSGNHAKPGGPPPHTSPERE